MECSNILHIAETITFLGGLPPLMTLAIYLLTDRGGYLFHILKLNVFSAFLDFQMVTFVLYSYRANIIHVSEFDDRSITKNYAVSITDQMTFVFYNCNMIAHSNVILCIQQKK